MLEIEDAEEGMLCVDLSEMLLEPSAAILVRHVSKAKECNAEGQADLMHTRARLLWR